MTVNKEALREYNRNYYLEHKIELNQKSRIQFKKWFCNNKEYHREYNKRYHMENKEILKTKRKAKKQMLKETKKAKILQPIYINEINIVFD